MHTAFLKVREVSGLQSVVPMGNFNKHPDSCWLQHSRTQANQISGGFEESLLGMSTDGPTRGDAQLNLLFPKNGRTRGNVGTLDCSNCEIVEFKMLI